MLVQKLNLIQKYLLAIGLMNILCMSTVTADVQTIRQGKDLVISCQHALIALDSTAGKLTSTVRNDAFLCMAYLGGMMTTAQHANELAKLRYALSTEGRGNQQSFNLYCFDWQLPYQKIARIVLEFGQRESRYLQRPAHELAIRALQTTYPCP